MYDVQGKIAFSMQVWQIHRGRHVCVRDTCEHLSASRTPELTTARLLALLTNNMMPQDAQALAMGVRPEMPSTWIGGRGSYRSMTSCAAANKWTKSPRVLT